MKSPATFAPLSAGLALSAALAAGACRNATPEARATETAATAAGGVTASAPAAQGARATIAPLPPGAVRHIVAFKYKPTATPAQIGKVTRAFGALKSQVPGILAFEHGVNHSPENMNQGFTHVYMLTFESAAARDAYLPHPAHKAFGDLVGQLGIWAGGFVVDYTPTPSE
ncbi:MAG TPA: Dabb family protein [Terriglobales bacterium]|nr:Dabb family protein [Terriglobales bacterium]